MNKNSLSSCVTLSALVLVAILAAPAATAQVGYSFVPLTPCRLVDTRLPNGTNGGPALNGPYRSFQVRGLCGVQATAKAVALTVTAVSPTADGFFALWPSGVAYPGSSNLNFVANQPPIANFAIIALSTATLDLTAVYGTAGGPAQAHMIIDVMGYYQ